MLDRMQAGKMTEQQAQQGRQMMQKMDELGNIVGDQQRLMDDTYGEQRKDGDQPGQQGKQGQRGQQKGQQSGRGQQQGERRPGGGQPEQQGDAGEKGQQGQQGKGGQGGQLGQRQSQLREKLDKLQREMRELGMGSEKLDAARDAMEGAEEALKKGDLDTATDEQGKALENMRQGAQQMAQEMLKNMPHATANPATRQEIRWDGRKSRKGRISAPRSKCRTR